MLEIRRRDSYRTCWLEYSHVAANNAMQFMDVALRTRVFPSRAHLSCCWPGLRWRDVTNETRPGPDHPGRLFARGWPARSADS